ncbi:uncharacterized protein LOC120273305 [Dioscorea cayenensis subsp. rotundata]|uniref:Uncharacterized protein LOC120273305 n=1 Tax=Dioscorea cayennensis subsp. rotundata TaxID=55577 RepID=A0AB40C921_DIOCR|nr:uncharacterized protein LOC120273305 [Dioscorea cayenensis subsp. rotundata]
MRGEWNGLQALICNECQYAYCVHCFAHCLQLALVASSREVKLVHQFFEKLGFIINVVTSSSKSNDELRDAQAADIVKMLAMNELELGRGLNQTCTLQRAGDTRWSSHLKSISNLIKIFNATSHVLDNISTEGRTSSQRGDADYVYTLMKSFDFVFVLHLMKKLMEITEILCQALQRESQDILNALHLVSTTKELIQNLRETGWEAFLLDLKYFCVKHDIDIPDMDATFVARKGRLNSRFNEYTLELLSLSSALDPIDGYKSFNIDYICKLAKKFYSQDFSEEEMILLRLELQHFEVDVLKNAESEDLSTISEQNGLSAVKPMTDPKAERGIRNNVPDVDYHCDGTKEPRNQPERQRKYAS